jgi:hypothetical protein
MAESNNNVVTYGLKGLIGKLLVFKRKGDKMIVSDRPQFKDRVFTSGQLAIQQKFKAASIYASNSIKDPLLKQAYGAVTTGNQTAFNKAFADYQLAPEFIDIPHTEDYNGAIGDKISAKVTDDFRVVEVKVMLHSAAGVLIEQGSATLLQNGLTWEYTAIQVNPEVPGTKITFKAYDMPGNETVLEVEL